MQDRYAGDIGDFSKLGLLRALAGGKPRLRVGLIWQLTRDEANSDGGIVDYPDLRPCDPQLYDALHPVAHAKRRNVKALEEARVLPADTAYFADCLDLAGCGSAVARQERRTAWHQRAVLATDGADLVCLDPDNGLEVKSVARTAPKGPKYVFFDELKPFLDRGQSLVIYQHLTRRGTAEAQARGRFEQLRRRLGPALRAYELFAMRWRRASGRLYLVLAAPQHRLALCDRAAAMLSSAWSGRFTLATPGT
jgi:hypothetical protein